MRTTSAIALIVSLCCNNKVLDTQNAFDINPGVMNWLWWNNGRNCDDTTMWQNDWQPTRAIRHWWKNLILHSSIPVRRSTQRVIIDGQQSRKAEVCSGVPQGMVINWAPSVSLIHKWSSTKCRLFADDCLVYHDIYGPEDLITLQRDI